MVRAKIKMEERIMIVLARSGGEPVSGAFLRKQVEYYIKSLGWKEIDFLNFLDKLEDQQKILKSVQNMKVHYELFNPAKGLGVLAEAHRKANIVQQSILELRYPELLAHAQRLKEDRTKEEERVHTAQKEVIGADPEGFGVKTRRTL